MEDRVGLLCHMFHRPRNSRIIQAHPAFFASTLGEARHCRRLQEEMIWRLQEVHSQGWVWLSSSKTQSLEMILLDIIGKTWRALDVLTHCPSGIGSKRWGPRVLWGDTGRYRDTSFEPRGRL